MSTRILMYHGIESASMPSEMTDPGDLRYVLGLDTFEVQLDWLARNGWAIQLTDGAPGARSAVLTFDDGHASNYELALPRLRDRGLPAYFFITTDWIGSDYYMSADMLTELAAAGMTIGGHGASHSFLTDLSDADAQRELESSRDRLQDILGTPVTTMSAPGGRVDLRIARLAKAAGYTDVYISDNKPRFSLPGLRIHGRLALKRNYSAKQFANMVRRNREPGFLLTSGLRTAKRVLGNDRYLAARGLALRLLELRKRR